MADPDEHHINPSESLKFREFPDYLAAAKFLKKYKPLLRFSMILRQASCDQWQDVPRRGTHSGKMFRGVAPTVAMLTKYFYPSIRTGDGHW
jgi:hypothetical protein